MGDPKKKKRKFTTPKVPYDTEALMSELKLLGSYGLRNKRELWRIRTQLSTIRRRARDQLSLTIAEREVSEKALIAKLSKQGLMSPNGRLEDVLRLSVEDLLERRLQTIIFRKGMVKSLYQARQLIAHGHISIKGRKVLSPSYNVEIDDEAQIEYTLSSPYNNKDHPLRQDMATYQAAGGPRD